VIDCFFLRHKRNISSSESLFLALFTNLKYTEYDRPFASEVFRSVDIFSYLIIPVVYETGSLRNCGLHWTLDEI